MADVAHPTVTEPTTAPAHETIVPETKPVESTVSEIKPTEETPAVTDTAPEVPPKDEAAETKEEAKVEPIYKGIVKYVTGKGPKMLLPKPAYTFFFHEDAIKPEELKHTVKFQETGGRETAAWTSETGKGVLFYHRENANKSGPPGALLLYAVEELKGVDTNKIAFKLHGTTHNITAATKAERDGWLLSLEEKIEEAKALKEEIFASEGYKSVLEKLNHPTPLVLGTAAADTKAVHDNLPKKSVDDRKEERKARSEAKKENKLAKDRSQSRGKKFFDQIRGKKETKADGAETSPEPEVAAVTAPEPAETIEHKETPTPAPAAAPLTAPVAAPVEESTLPSTTAAAVEQPKIGDQKSRRSSKFIDRLKSFGSPTTEKKQEDFLPESEGAVAEAAPAIAPIETTAPPEVAKTEGVAPIETTPALIAETPVEEAKVAESTPAEKTERRRSLFDFTGFKLNKNKKDVTKEETKAEETTEVAKPVEEDVKPIEPVTETPAAHSTGISAAPVADIPVSDVHPASVSKDVADTPIESTEATETKKPEAKKEKTSSGGIIGLIRSKSKALRSGPAKKEKPTKATTPEKLEEKTEEPSAEDIEPTSAEPATSLEKKEETGTPATIGDVVPEAVNIGTAPAANTTVAAHA